MSNTKKRYIGHSGQIFTVVQEMYAGEEIQLQGTASDYKSDEPVHMPWACRLSTDAIFDQKIHFGSKDAWLKNAQENTFQTNEHWPPKNVRLFAKNKNKVEWGLEDYTDKTVNEMFETVDNAVVIPMNQDIVDRKYKLLNSGIIDDNQWVDNIMAQVFHTRPSTYTYTNDCTQLCVTFMPTGPSGFDIDNYSAQGWANGAHFMWEDDGKDFTITKKGTVDYLIPIHEVTVMNSTLGSRIPAGSPVELTSDSITIPNQTNIILHIYR